MKFWISFVMFVFAVVPQSSVAVDDKSYTGGTDPWSDSTAQSENGAVSLAEKYESASAKLERLRMLPTDTAAANRALQALLEFGGKVPSDIAKPIFEAVCAGFIANGDNASYVKTRPRLASQAEFEKTVLDVCESCAGTGKAPCTECRGTGKCPIASCNNGRRFVAHLGNVSCPTCGGTAKCPNCRGTGKAPYVPCPHCKGVPKKVNREKARAVFESRISDVIDICKKRTEQEKTKVFDEKLRAKGLVQIEGKWMTPGSVCNIPLAIIQKLSNRGISMNRAPMDGERGGLLAIDSHGNPCCLITSEDEWNWAKTGRTYRFDIFRCGTFMYKTEGGEIRIVPLFATDLETALRESKSGEYSERFSERFSG